MFQDLKDKTNDMEKSDDRVGGGFEPLPTDVYTGTIKLAYVGHAQNSKARSVNLHIDINGQETRHQIWVTNRNGEPFYMDKTDKTKKMPLPGFSLVDDMCMFATEQGLTDQGTEEKVVKLYNFEQRQEVNTPVQAMTALHGKTMQFAITRELVDKRKKDEQSGEYEPTGETRMENVIQKVMHEDTGRTVNEYMHEIESPEFRTAWLEKNKGKDRDRTEKKSGVSAGASGAGRPALAGNSSDKPAAKKLFG